MYYQEPVEEFLALTCIHTLFDQYISHSWRFCTTIFKIQTLIKSIIRILCLKTLPQVLDNTSLTKAKTIGICLPCPLMQEVAAGFYGKIEIIAISSPCCPLD